MSTLACAGRASGLCSYSNASANAACHCVRPNLLDAPCGAQDAPVTVDDVLVFLQSGINDCHETLLPMLSSCSLLTGQTIAYLENGIEAVFNIDGNNIDFSLSTKGRWVGIYS